MLGRGEWRDVPISRAVAASTALPMVYEPVELRGRHLMDGGIASTTNVDVAVEAGAKFIIVVNPLVPYVNDFETKIPTMFGSRVRRVSDMGLPGIGNQAFRLMAHARLHLAVESWKHRFPDVDIILIEPEPDDELMFGTSVLEYSSRLQIAKHGFESVTQKLARDYKRYKEIAARHGIEISARRVRKVIDTVEDEAPEGASAWRRILEQTTGALLRSPTRREGRRALGARRAGRITGTRRADVIVGNAGPIASTGAAAETGSVGVRATTGCWAGRPGTSWSAGRAGIAPTSNHEPELPGLGHRGLFPLDLGLAPGSRPRPWGRPPRRGRRRPCPSPPRARWRAAASAAPTSFSRMKVATKA